MAPKKNKTYAEIGLIQLRNCLVNLPSNISQVLSQASTAAQNVVVELEYPIPSEPKPGQKQGNTFKSVYVGWTGFSSHRTGTRPSTVSTTARYGTSNESRGIVEIDATFGRILGLSEHLKVAVILHLDPIIAHTVNIEPLTVSDWEIIELHANFLETNLQAQIRAIPNPVHSGNPLAHRAGPHPLTLHLSPTSTANVSVTAITPPAPGNVAFLKLSPDAEVIVAPKVNSRLTKASRVESSSTTSTSRKSATGRSGPGASRHRSSKVPLKDSIFLRGSDQSVFLDGHSSISASQVAEVFVDAWILNAGPLRGATYACVSVVSSSAIHGPTEFYKRLNSSKEEGQSDGNNSIKLVAKLSIWPDAPGPQQALLSPLLAKALGCGQVVGFLLRVELAPTPLTTSTVSAINIAPFMLAGPIRPENLKSSSESKAPSGVTITRTKPAPVHGAGKHIRSGPLTDGMPVFDMFDEDQGFSGGILQFEYANQARESRKGISWIKGEGFSSECGLVQPVPNPYTYGSDTNITPKPVPIEAPLLVGSEAMTNDILRSLLHASTILVTGNAGSGKTSIALAVAHRLRSAHMFHTSYMNCRKLIGDDARPAAIKAILSKVFMTAAYGTRLGGRSLVILDDLDKLCPAETELQVGNENSRNRQMSESVRSAIRGICNSTSSVSLMAMAQSKDSLHQVLTGGHIIQETVALKAPSKDVRLGILKLAARQETLCEKPGPGLILAQALSSHGSDSPEEASSVDQASDSSSLALRTQPKIDFLEIASRTDGFMPGDLQLLASRAGSEALTRCLSQSNTDSSIKLVTEDFLKAINGYKPASLRNVTLQTSAVTFDSIGGLRSAKKVLIETLQYPTMYAPMFDQCPLRLRSGLLLYGHPGCGKTLLASAVAGECGLNFISVKGPEILNKYIGASEKSIRDLFERAEAARPCVLFFDEFDSIAPKRGHDSTGVTDRVVNQLLTQMDGAEGLSGVYVLAATSRPDLIDPALLRPGRLDKAILCDMPSLEDREDILHTVSKDLKLQSSILVKGPHHGTLGEIAQRTNGYTNADLQAILYNAHLRAIHDLLREQKPVRRQQKSHAETNGIKRWSDSRARFLSFPFDQNLDDALTKDQFKSFSKQLSNDTKVGSLEAKLSDHKSARRKRRERQKGMVDIEMGPNINTAATKVEITIDWRHLEFSLESTRTSMSSQERLKLDGIYKEFEIARSGEMPSGQASSEVGVRSSLM